MVSTSKLYMLKVVFKLKTSKSLKLLLVDMKANNILVRLEMTGIVQNKQKCLIFIVVPSRKSN